MMVGTAVLRIRDWRVLKEKKQAQIIYMNSVHNQNLLLTTIFAEEEN